MVALNYQYLTERSRFLLFLSLSRMSLKTFHQYCTVYTLSKTTPNRHSSARLISQFRLMTTNAPEERSDVLDIIKHIQLNHRILICMRGAPGSGKSYLARSIIDRTMHGDYENHIFSTDDFFYDKHTQRYHYDRSKLSHVHERNQLRVVQRLINGWSPIFVDNTSMKWWEMYPYIKVAVQNDYIIKTLEPDTQRHISVVKLAERNKHNIDQEAIAKIISNYEPGTVNDILRSMQIHNYQMTPHLRRFPDHQPVDKAIRQPNETCSSNEVERNNADENDGSECEPRIIK